VRRNSQYTKTISKRTILFLAGKRAESRIGTAFAAMLLWAEGQEFDPPGTGASGQIHSNKFGGE
jgi:hypothetical protein